MQKADVEPNTWEMYATEHIDAQGKFVYLHFGTKRFVELHGLHKPIVPVVLTEDPEGSYWGWLQTGDTTVCMVWPSKKQLEMCFPYGTKADADQGYGRVVRMRAEVLRN